jgi:hypothetical protein
MHVVILLKLFLTKKKLTKEKNTGTHYQPDPRPTAEPNMLPRGSWSDTGRYHNFREIKREATKHALLCVRFCGPNFNHQSSITTYVHNGTTDVELHMDRASQVSVILHSCSIHHGPACFALTLVWTVSRFPIFEKLSQKS